MEPVTEAKRKAFLAYKAKLSPSTLQALRTARNKAQQTARHCANTYWLSLCSSIQAAADIGNARGMYEGIKKAIGPTPSKTAPLKSKTDTALNAIPDLPVMEELDTPPTVEELSKAIDCLACGKAPGNDGIPPEVLKSGKPALLQPLHNLLCLCWEQGYIPQDMRDAKIITLYKNKGDRSDCNNYRGISLLSTVGKVFARVALAHLQVLASRVYPESQSGFRVGRSTVDMIFSLRQLQEKCQEQQMPLYIAFIDLTKAFDLVSRSGLFSLLQKIGCPQHLLAVVTSFHDNMHSTVCYSGETSKAFQVSSGVKQGCVLAPTLFGIFFSMLLKYAFKDCSEGVYIHTRSDGKLYNIAHLCAKTKITEVLIREMLFADDAALTSHTEDGLQQLVTCLFHACKEFGLTISLRKTKVMAQGTETPPNIAIDGYTLEGVENFPYLGSTISSSLSIDSEISSRIAKAATAMAKLNQRVWNNSSLTEKTRLCVYQACILSTLLYGSETWTTYARHERKLNSFHMRCLRRILQIKWQDRVPNTEVLERANISTLHSGGSAMSREWTQAVFPKTSSMVSWSKAKGEQGAQNCDSKTSARRT
ncbi:RNA-directed DNA polymerase from mobile element jockey-like protein [Labeo rohita]|uniref:RNA-directed DNA polymerase from mobile element jockey-like protein n=2 Tax=Labeo rohita TaxID=84645 RepID=A0A498M0L0_LABRO|nr:RNA-directed DNA polymerase from mobile element jockey-like protein [Labeo rohita]